VLQRAKGFVVALLCLALNFTPHYGDPFLYTGVTRLNWDKFSIACMRAETLFALCISYHIGGVLCNVPLFFNRYLTTIYVQVRLKAAVLESKRTPYQ
jgi:hypothetical protein